MEPLGRLRGILRSTGTANQACCLFLKGTGGLMGRPQTHGQSDSVLGCFRAGHGLGAVERSPRFTELLSGKGLSLLTSFIEKDLEGRGGEGRMGYVWVWGIGTEPALEEEHCCGFRGSLEGDRHIPGLGPGQEQQIHLGTGAGAVGGGDADPGCLPVTGLGREEGLSCLKVEGLGRSSLVGRGRICRDPG